MTAQVAIVVPVLRRPHRVKPLLENIAATTPEGSYWVRFMVSPGDASGYDVIEVAKMRLPVIWTVLDADYEGQGDYAKKINLGYLLSEEPLIFTGADDLRFHPGWLDVAMAYLAPGIGVVGTNDLGNPKVMRGEHSTHSLVTRDYADRGGSPDQDHMIYHEGYPHLFCDTELIEVARARGAFAFAEDSRVEHIHPAWGKAETDELYAEHSGARALRETRKMFERRRRLWAPA